MRSFLRDLDYTPDPDDPAIWKSMGNTFFGEKNYDIALQCYENAVEINHSYMDALHNMAITCKILGRNDEAVKIFDSIKTIKNKKMDGNYQNKGYFLSKSKNEPEKIRYRIIDNTVGIPLWLYGFAVFFVFYGVAANRIVGGIMWAILILGIGYLITKIRIRRNRRSKFSFISVQAVVSIV